MFVLYMFVVHMFVICLFFPPQDELAAAHAEQRSLADHLAEQSRAAQEEEDLKTAMGAFDTERFGQYNQELNEEMLRR